MQLGFVTAILPDLELEEVFKIASSIGYDCIEVMCWPPGKAERRYAGVSHIDVTSLTKAKIQKIQEYIDKYKVQISALGYYPNPLDSDAKSRRTYSNHIKKVIRAAAKLNIGTITSFVGRDPAKSVAANWPQFLKTWRPIVKLAKELNVNIGIENCPMLFTDDEWPGGKNLATTPAIWEKMWADIPDSVFGLNYDPSHFIWQHMDYVIPIQKHAQRFHHVHAKDVRIDKELLNRHGIMAYPNLWHTPKLPGLGDVNWGRFFSELSSSGYTGAVCVEVEDRSYEGNIDKRVSSLVQSHTFLRQFIPKKVHF